MRNLCWILWCVLVSCASNAITHAAESLPNILWLTAEDHGPHLGCYGDTSADTPQLDNFAKTALKYHFCWSNAPVCAPARTTLITGMYPPSTGAEHMRSSVRLPAAFKLYPELLKAAGYYCTNNRKEDYNVVAAKNLWDESSTSAHWKNRPAGKPFFAVFNHEITHESQIRKRPHTAVHDPAQVRVPAYHPDTPEVRRDWAQYYDNLTTMDQQVGKKLQDLQAAGLAEDTIVFFYSDHGSGMPRNKRWPYNSGLHVPLLVHIPAKFAHLRPREYQPGGNSERLVSFVDFVPTLLSLAGVKPPEWLQGHAFAGKYDAGPQSYVFGFRGRMDERFDLVRSVRDQRYVYLRQFMPHLPYGQHVAYMFETPTTRVWKAKYDAGELTPEQSHFWKEKPTEELYDLQADPDEVRNLAALPEHQETLKRLRTACEKKIYEIHDVGFMHESEMLSRSANTTPYELGHDPQQYDIWSVYAAADRASRRRPEDLSAMAKDLTHSDPTIRYWSALGLLQQKQAGVNSAAPSLKSAMGDASPIVRIVAAQAIAQFGNKEDRRDALQVLLKQADIRSNQYHAALAALNAIDNLDRDALPIVSELKRLPIKSDTAPTRAGDYIERTIQKTLADIIK